jgi:AmiR/NasT family two-component response regulator
VNPSSRSPQDVDAIGVEALTEAVRARQLVSQAVGITMERFDLSPVRALEYLVQVSRSSRLKLRVVAAELVAHANERGSA